MCDKWKETLVVLIPKVKNLILPIQFLPISLCLSTYKILEKVLLNRMVPYISKLISYEQVAFIKGRSINDHVLIAQEVIHKLRNSKSSKGFVAFKIDMEQAYDSMGWTTLEKALHYFGFPYYFSKLILNCIQSSNFSISINGSLSKWIEGQCGFRQGCPLSPYLFIICAQLLSNAFKQKGDALGVRVSSNGPSISHLLYVDDVIIFSEATLKATKEIKKILDNFCSWIGLSINSNKSSMIFSKLVRRRRKKAINRLLGFNP
ncbi:putative mitochondrial protein [Dendrobium catenatum]|uniref:Putative mitochondrial protein n=1 Tax=Dendrobium catenatum TaxID=906689 RepID=A0A2I0WWZ0_9ASPA|nr:putative mitochondrial protein [Dendrobium catenatum]